MLTAPNNLRRATHLLADGIKPSHQMRQTPLHQPLKALHRTPPFIAKAIAPKGITGLGEIVLDQLEDQSHVTCGITCTALRLCA